MIGPRREARDREKPENYKLHLPTHPKGPGAPADSQTVSSIIRHGGSRRGRDGGGRLSLGQQGSSLVFNRTNINKENQLLSQGIDPLPQRPVLYCDAFPCQVFCFVVAGIFSGCGQCRHDRARVSSSTDVRENTGPPAPPSPRFGGKLPPLLNVVTTGSGIWTQRCLVPVKPSTHSSQPRGGWTQGQGGWKPPSFYSNWASRASPVAISTAAKKTNAYPSQGPPDPERHSCSNHGR